MLSELKDVITALAVNRRGYVTMKVRTTSQKSQVVIFRASSMSEIAFPPTIDPTQVTTTKSKIITELALDYGLQPMWANPDGTEIRFGLMKWFPELACVAI